MQPAVVFALASNPGEEFHARTRVAIASLRVSNPQCRVVVACDLDSFRSYQAAADPLLQEADQTLAIDTAPGDRPYRSRYIKTSLRSRIEGPFLYLDSDVFVRGCLDEVFALECDIAGARNHSRNEVREQVWEQDALMLSRMGWEVRPDAYLNGGVLYWNDTPDAHRLADEWHRRWKMSSSSQHSIRDQPAFNSALLATNPRLEILPHRFNAQVFTAPRSSHGATVWHFYAGDKSRIPSRYNALVQTAMRGGSLDPDTIVEMAATEEPWSPSDFPDVLAKFATQIDQVFGLQADLASTRHQSIAAQTELENELRNVRSLLLDSQHAEKAARSELEQARSGYAHLQSLHNELLSQHTELDSKYSELLSQHTDLDSKHGELLSQHTDLDSKYRELLSQHRELSMQYNELNSLHHELLGTRSWRLTRPLRAIDEAVRRILRRLNGS